jgi:hypothetical protein
MKFSISTGCFYPDNVTYESLPEDVVDATVEDFEFCMARASDETIAYADGNFSLARQPGPTDDDRKAATKAKARALLAATDYTQLPDVAASISNAEAFAAYRALVRAIFKTPIAEPEWPSVPDPSWS